MGKRRLRIERRENCGLLIVDLWLRIGERECVSHSGSITDDGATFHVGIIAIYKSCSYIIYNESCMDDWWWMGGLVQTDTGWALEWDPKTLVILFICRRILRFRTRFTKSFRHSFRTTYAHCSWADKHAYCTAPRSLAGTPISQFSLLMTISHSWEQLSVNFNADGLLFLPLNNSTFFADMQSTFGVFIPMQCICAWI